MDIMERTAYMLTCIYSGVLTYCTLDFERVRGRDVTGTERQQLANDVD
jgi:hypothetical protein